MRRTLAAVTATAALTVGGVAMAPAVLADTTVAQETTDMATNPDGSDKTGLWGLLGLLGLAGLVKKKEHADTNRR